MPITVGQRTLGQTVVEVARQLGLILAQGTATAGTALTLTDATNMRLPVANANDLVGKFLYIYGGTSAGTVREVTSYGTIGVFTWTGNATAPDTTSTWVLLNIDPQYILDAVAWAQRVLGFEGAQDYRSTSLITDNLLGGLGDFEEWPDGTSSAPNGWTLTGAGAAVAREPNIRAHGLYSAALTPGGGAQAYLAHTIPIERTWGLSNRNVTVYGRLNAAASGVNDVAILASNQAGTTTTTTRAGADATGTWQSIYDDVSSTAIAMPTKLRGLEIRCRGNAGAAVMYFDDIAVIADVSLHDYELPYSLVALKPTIYLQTSDIRAAADTPETYGRPLSYPEDWRLERQSGSTRDVLHFNVDLPSARHLLLEGLQVPAVVSATATNLNLPADSVAAVAADHIRGSDRDAARLAAQFQRRFSTIRNRGAFVWLEHTLVG